LGTFTSTDPADYYWNSYSYCGGDVVNLVDPNGEFPFVGFFWAMALGGAAVGGGIAAANGGDGYDILQGAMLGFGAGMVVGAAPFALQGVFSGGAATTGSVFTAATSSPVNFGRLMGWSVDAYNLGRQAYNLSLDHGTGIIGQQFSGGAGNGRSRFTEPPSVRIEEENARAILTAGPAENAPSRVLQQPTTRTTNFVVTPRGEAVQIPNNAQGPSPTRASGMQYTNGSGENNGMRPDATGVRIMDANRNQGPRAIYMTPSGAPVNPYTGQTQPAATHYYLLPW